MSAREFYLDAATYQYRLETLIEHGVVLTYPSSARLRLL